MQRLLATLRAAEDAAEALVGALTVIAETMGVGRASLLLATPRARSVLLVASSEEPMLLHVPVDLAHHPRLRDLLTSDAPELVVTAEDPSPEALFSDGAGEPPRVVTFVVLPPGGVRGVLVIDLSSPDEMTELRAIAYAGVLASALASSRLVEELREQTNPRAAVVERPSRSALLDTYAEFFDAASEGIFVVGGDGRLLFVNRAGEHVTGWARSGLSGRSLLELIAEPYRTPVLQLVQQAASGTAFAPFDVELETTSGDPVVVSMAASTLFADTGAAVLSFRDVTMERSLEDELRHTKEFLERIIDSTIDAIVAADILGTIILFNNGAERITGWRAEDAVGRMSVEGLYPPGAAREIMRMMRTEERGGVGRLEATRQLVSTASGRPVPVMLSAAIVYEEGREIASVGVFSDLRERLSMEASLVEVREKLQITERQALVAELAGTTAHELNQPLTSIMGYAELLKRRVARGPLATDDDKRPVNAAIDVILREADRMAEIVRKIGQITRYETKPYVGETRILDLEKSST